MKAAPKRGAFMNMPEGMWPLAVAAGLAFFCIPLLFHIRDRYAVVPDYRGVWLTGVIALCLGAFWFLFFRRAFGRAFSIPRLALITVIMVAFVLPSTMLALFAVNCVLDPGPESRHMQRVVELSGQADGGRRSVKVKHWVPDAPPQRLRISRRQFVRIAEAMSKAPAGGVCLEVITKPGLLGTQWIRSYEVVEEHPPDSPSSARGDE